ncbi:MAG: PEP-CTERM sorting domain-containing protein [Phycisphaerales bacterium]|nr:PEP-CTERM sorting domain-containing protein [Phycisphaerales bacterium]
MRTDWFVAMGMAALLGGTASADITCDSQSDSASVQGFVAANGFGFDSYNDTLSGSTLLAPVSYNLSNTRTVGPNSVWSTARANINATTFGTQGLLVQGSTRCTSDNVYAADGNTTANGSQNYQLWFTVDAPTLATLSVNIIGANGADGSIGLLSNPVSFGWNAGVGLHVVSMTIGPGSYGLNCNTGTMFSASGPEFHFIGEAEWTFELGQVPAPSSTAALAVGLIGASRRRR